MGTLWIMELASNVATVEGMPELLPVLSTTIFPFASSDSVTPVPATRRLDGYDIWAALTGKSCRSGSDDNDDVETDDSF